jgi:hypothetical protein
MVRSFLLVEALGDMFKGWAQSFINNQINIEDNSMTTQVPQDIEAVRDRLIHNAFDYLEKGLGEFSAELNFAVLHFYGGIELIVKGCLLHEDWRLVVQEPGDCDWNKFYSGKQRTVGLETAAKRLSKLRGTSFDQDTLIAFKKLCIHRNQLTHFFHPGLCTAQVRKEVARELLVAWYYLHKLFKTPVWGPVFQSVWARIASIDTRLQAQRDFLQTVFSTQVAILPGIATLVSCPVCGFRALNTQTNDCYLDSHCLVCGFEEPSHRAVKHGEQVIQGHCLQCGESDCVFHTEYGACCSACGESFSHITTCEYCGESFADSCDEDFGDYETGCVFCWGNLGYLMGKDD